MTMFTSILVPLDGSARAAKSLGSAVWLADKLDAKCHLLYAAEEMLPATEALANLQIPREYWSRITLHQSASYPEAAIVRAIREFRVDLVIMSAQGGGAEASAAVPAPLGHVTRAILADCDLPVLLIPPAFVERLPWRSVLVPVSGEAEADQILALVIRLAQPLNLSVHVAHVLDISRHGYLTDTEYADAPYHEYANRLEELVNRAIWQCSPAERQCLAEGVALCRGDVSEELERIIRKRNIDMVAIGWHGHLAPGRAQVLQRLLKTAATPILLVKSAPPPEFELKVGDELE